VRDPLLAGVTTGDIVMLSGERVFGFTADEYTVADEFSYIVDYDEVAPFANRRSSLTATSRTASSDRTAGRSSSTGSYPRPITAASGPALVPFSLPKATDHHGIHLDRKQKLLGCRRK
jgi:hypothetical protein